MNGFRFEHKRPDANTPGGMRVTTILAVARTADDGLSAVMHLMGSRNARLIDQGDHVLAEAKALGIADGKAKTL